MNDTKIVNKTRASLVLKSPSGKGKRPFAYIRRTGVLAVWLGLMSIGTTVAVLGVQPAQATNTISVDFNTAGELTNLFNDGYLAPAWTQNVSGGISGGGGITIPNNSSDLHISKQGLPLQVGATYTVGAYYLNKYNNGYGGLGFTTLTSGSINGGFATPLSAIGVTFHGGGGYMDNNSAITSATTSESWNTSLETITSPSWFYFKATLTCTGTNLFNQTFEIWQCDTNGNLGTKLTMTTVSGQSNAALGAATVIYPFFGASQSRFLAADGFAATTTATGVAATVTAPPTNQVLAVGETMNLSVTATGDEPLHYQWVKDGRILSGATNRVLSVASAGMANSGVYYVAVTNAYGLNLSRPATVTIGSPQLLVWGKNANGQLGDGTSTDKYFPASVASNVVTAAAGANHSLFVKGDNTLWAMGNNANGQLGDGTTANRSFAASVASNVVAVAAGAKHSLFLKSNGTLWAMGFNGDGQFGDGTWTDQHSPESVASNVVAVASGANHTLLLKSDGTVWAMGYNYDGELGDGTTANRNTPVAVQGATNAVAVAAGSGVSLFIKSDGTLWALGFNYDGELGDGTYLNRSTPVAVLNGSNAAAAAAGANHSLFLKHDGTLWAMGDGQYGQLGDGTTITKQTPPESVASNAVALAAGADHSLYLKNDGTLWAMGNNSNGQLGDGTVISRSNAVPIVGLALATVASGCVANHTLAVGLGLPPVITSQPASQTVVAGNQIALAVTAVGASSLSYQWQCNGTDLVNATNATYTLAQAALSDAGDYTVVVTNLFGSTISAPATLTVNQPTAIVTVTAAPANAGNVTGGGSHVVGSDVVLTATAANNWLFVSWNDGTTSNPYVITVPTTNVTYTASFAATATITVGANPDVAGSVTGGGTFMVGSTNLISAATSNGWIFAGWSDGTTNRFYSIVAVSNLTLLANFSPAATVTTVAAPLQGGVTAGDGIYAIGSSATLTATTTDGWVFLNWNGTITNNPWALVVPTSNTVCIANFGQVSTVTGLANPTNAGSVTGGGAYFVGTNAVLTATASNDWQFASWNDGTTNNPYVITVPATNITYTANFAATAIITVGASPNTGGFVTGGGTVLVGSTNLISATASNNWIFVGWNDGATNNLYSIVVASNLTLMANFAPAATVATVAMPSIGGATAGDGTYAVGSSASVTTTASNGWAFLNWNGITTNNPWSFVVAAGTTVCTANFAPISLVTGLAAPTNAGSVTGGGVYFAGSNAVLTATTSNNWQFASWNDGTTNNPYTITVPATNITYTANFAATATITVGASPNNGGSVTGGGTFLAGTTNLITATASNNWTFARWLGGSSNNPLSIVVVSNRTYTADFEMAATVTTVVLPPEGGFVSGGGIHAIGTTASLTATATNGWCFLNWNGSVTNYTQTGNTNRTLQFTVISDITHTANFAQVENDFVYTVINTKGLPQAKIIGYNGSTTSKIVVPSVIGGLSVAAIGTGAFWWNKCSKISIPESVETIEESSIAADSITFTGGADAILPFLADGAFAAAGEVILDYALPAAALLAMADVLINIFENLVMLQVIAAPESGGYCNGYGLYLEGSVASISATPEDGWRFTQWSDGITNRQRMVTVNGGGTYTANFVQRCTVTVQADPTSEAGVVTGGGTYDVGTMVTLTAAAEEGWEFSGWSDETTNATNTFPMPAHNVTYTATFDVKVEGEAEPPTGGVIMGNGSYPQGTTVPLTAVHNNGWRFTGWFVENTTTNNLLTNAIIVLVPAYPLPPPLKYKAHFAQTIMVTGLANPTNAGSVAGNGVYDVDDTNITLTATASNNWQFINWTDGITNNPYTVTLPLIVVTDLLTNITYTANFGAMATITVAASPNAGGLATGGGTFLVGSTNLLTATPANNWQFIKWNDGITNNPYAMVVTSNLTYTANFTASNPTNIIVSFSGNTLTLAWPTDHLGWILQAQTNDLIISNWFDVPGTAGTNSAVITIDPSNPAVFYRLRQP